MNWLWRKRRYHSHDVSKLAHQGTPAPKNSDKTLKISKSILTASILAGLMVATTLPTHANIFDPLLRILLPFYKKSPKAEGEAKEPLVEPKEPLKDDIIQTPTHTHTNKEASSVVIPQAETTKRYANIPEILLEDTLIAENVEPILNIPDLYALMDAEFAADRGDIRRALNIYKAESFKKNATNVFERALSLSIEYETPAQSLAFATAWQDRNPDHIPAWFYVTHLALKAGEYNQAAAMISTILHYDPRSDLGQILTGIIPPKREDKRALLYALQGLGENNASISVLRAGILMGLADYQAARLHVNQALSIEPNNLAFITLKLDILRAANQLDELWNYLHQARKQLPKEKELYLYEARHLIEVGDLSQAWQLLTQAVKNTQDKDIILLAGLVGLDSGRYTDAIEILKPLTKNTEIASQAHYYIGIGYERLGNPQQARENFEKVHHYEHVLDATNKVVGFYLADNNTTDAIKTLIRLRDEFENYATDSYILQAEIYLRQNNQQKAKDLLTVANREYPDDDRLLYASFQLLENELEPQDKRQAIDRLLEIDEYNPRYRLADAKLRLSQNANDDALNTASEISNISFDDPEYDSQLQLDALLVLGNHALAEQNYEAVIDYLQAPYEVMPNLNVGITLLRAYQGLGNNEAVANLLADLQSRFANSSAIADDSQIY
ncbi:hypothetical protein C0140_00525 [Moraxella catarrhalis]|uniref:tetratricopeptide repeat protein n=1 Tax=Moraxella catarrhalis TaxID=480 RepID=UPI00128B3275|nr:hypothetical protein [Moraxella catarrhalis]MPX12848.1 hypothetical protein [Moraxella catarrhalis]